MSECYSFVVNGVPCSTEEEKPLLRYLRDELRLTSVKDGCSEGACGTCTILVDGKAVKACVLSTKRAAGKEIVTVEGLSEAEREAFVYAFGAVGAVQCGFCIPGMVMAGKALLDQNPNPSEAEIKKAIRGNVCRCTGYKKIIRFALTVAVCWLIAYGVAKPLALWALSGQSGKIQENVALLVGMVLYTGLNYFGQRFFAFRKKNS